MSTIRLIYIILHIFEIWMLYIAGEKMSKTTTNKAYWKASLWAIIPYIIVLGLRFGHNIDWNHYYNRYMEMEKMDWSTSEPLYHLTFYIFNTLGIPYSLFISLQVAFFMFSFLLIAKYFRHHLNYVLFLLPVVAISNDNYIRWYWGVSFFLVSYYFFLSNNKKRYSYTLFYFILAVLVHNGTILLALLFPASTFLAKKCIPVKISTIAVFVSVFFLSISIMSFLSDIATVLYLYMDTSSVDSQISHYLTKVDSITSEGLSDTTGIKQYGLTTKISLFLSYLPIITYGPRILSKFKYGMLFYNIFVIGAFIHPFFSTVEIFDRYSKMLLIFQAIVAGIVYYTILKSKNKSLFIKSFCLASLLCCFLPFIKYSALQKQDYKMMYIWDAGKKKYIDTELYINDMLKNR